MRIEKNEEIEDKTEDTVVEAKTAKCPECGGKYLPETGYCPKCKKKVGKKKEEVETEVVEEDTATEEAEIIEIPEEVSLTQEDGSTIVLEKGDKIQIVKAEAEDDDKKKKKKKDGEDEEEMDEIAQNLLKHNQKKKPAKRR